MDPNEKARDLEQKGFDDQIPDGMAGRGSGAALDGIDDPQVPGIEQGATLAEVDLGTDLGEDPTASRPDAREDGG